MSARFARVIGTIIAGSLVVVGMSVVKTRTGLMDARKAKTRDLVETAYSLVSHCEEVSAFIRSIRAA